MNLKNNTQLKEQVTKNTEIGFNLYQVQEQAKLIILFRATFIDGKTRKAST